MRIKLDVNLYGLFEKEAKRIILVMPNLKDLEILTITLKYETK